MSHVQSPRQNRASQEPMTPARPPVGVGASPLIAQLLALLVVATGVVGVQEAVSRVGLVGGPSWVSSTASALDGLSPPPWLLPAAVVLVVVGLLLLAVALKRRPRKSLTLQAQTGVYLRTGDLAKLVSERLDGLDAASDTAVRVSRRTIQVTVVSIAPQDHNQTATSEVHERLAPCLAAIESPPRVKVSIKNEVLT